MYQLFIYLQPGGDLDWRWQRQADGAVQQQGHADSLARLHLPAQLNASDAVLIIPTEWVLLQPVTLPKGASASAMPLLLEDQLFVDIDQQHWHDCTGKGRSRTLALLDQARLEQWRDQLLDQGLSLRAVLPDSWLLPATEQGCVWQQGERLLVRGPAQQGWAIATTLAERLVAQLPALADGEQRLSYGLDPQQQQRWQGSAQPLPDDPTSWLTARWQGETGLLPSDWQPRAPAALTRWRPALALAALLLVAFLSWLWLDHQQQGRVLAQQQQQLASLLREYPQLSAGPALEDQLLDQRLQHQQRQQLAIRLNRIAELLRVLPADQLNRMTLQNGQLQLRFKGLSAAQQEQLGQTAATQQYQLDWPQPGRRAVLKEVRNAD